MNEVGKMEQTVKAPLKRNKFYSAEFVDVCLKRFFAFLPFWTKCLTSLRIHDKEVPRANNGMVEGYFGSLKTAVRENNLKLGKFGSVRVGRYIDFQRERIEVDIKEMSIGYVDSRSKRTPKKKRDADMVYEELGNQEENWRGKAKGKSQKTIFFGSQSLSQNNKQA